MPARRPIPALFPEEQRHGEVELTINYYGQKLSNPTTDEFG